MSGSVLPADGVDARLCRYGDIVREAIAAGVPVDWPEPWLRSLVADYPARGGKAIRPALCLATCEAFGGRLTEALPSAVAIEFLHNAFLVHDDIEDGSQLRRGTATLHDSHGLPLALNAGDALMVLAQRALGANVERLGARIAALVANEFSVMAYQTIQGQATELGWIRDGVVDLTSDDYLELVMRKTCWYTTVHPMRVGALIGSWASADLDALVRFGFLLGAAFQIRDDLLNLVGCELTYGKEVLGDLVEGKRTLMLMHLLQHARVSERDRVVAFVRRPRSERTVDDARAVLESMYRHGSIEFAENFATGIAREADRSFVAAFGRRALTPSGEFVRAMIPYMIERAA
jgi:geranylgeranyl diphosphate synthase, type II